MALFRLAAKRLVWRILVMFPFAMIGTTLANGAGLLSQLALGITFVMIARIVFELLRRRMGWSNWDD